MRIPLSIAILASAAAAFSPAHGQDRIGVAGAANPLSQLARGSAVRTVVVGENVLFRDQIITSDEGLVQVLFVDGSTFTVGPGARVVIDEFVYQPATGTGSLVAEVTSGALRFVGGRLSKGNNQVRFRTPGGTLGVRGGIANIDLDPPCEDANQCPTETASLVFGEELTLSLPGGGTRRIHQAGYSFVLGSGGNVTVVPTNTLDQSSLQRRLSGQAGTNGGATEEPTAEDVVQSGVPQINSARAPFVVLPRPKPVAVSSRYGPDEETPGVTDTTNAVADTVTEQAQADVVREDVDRSTTPIPRPRPDGVDPRIAAFSTPQEVTAQGQTVTNPGRVGIVTGFDLEPFGAALIEKDGEVIALQIGEDVIALPSALGESAIEPFRSTVLGTEVSGTVFRGPDGFALVFLQESGGRTTADPNAVTYFLTGSPTPTNVVLSGEDDGRTLIRNYALGPDYHKRAQGIRSELRHLNPIVAREFGDALADAAETGFFIVERQGGAETAQTFYAGLLIDGQGANQRSAINVDAGFVTQAGNGLTLVGRRRGSYRLNAANAAAAMTGATGTLPAGEDGQSIFGADGNNFVYTTGVAVRPESDGDSPFFLDRERGDRVLGPGEVLSGVTSVADLEQVIDADTLTRTTRSLTGFAAGMVEPNALQSRQFRSTDVGDFAINFNAQDGTLGGIIRIHDVNNEDPVVRSYQLAFGTDIFGGASSTARGTFVHDDMFGAVATGPVNQEGSPQTTVTTDSGVTIAHVDATPDTYMVSADAVPQPQLFADAGVTPCECRFMEWGWWGTATNFQGDGPVGGRQDFAHLGQWVAGDVTPEADLPTVGSGEYEGHVVGNVVATQEDGSRARYVAVGELEVNFDFADRTGELNVRNFDGRNFGGTIFGNVASDGVSNQFSGQLSGSGLTGRTDGAFAAGPNSAVQGVLGAFDVRGAGYKAVGTYVGEQR
ncbi:MAG: hypothetical protein AAGF45_11955 [Pseudomonadota bacterium]